MKKVKFSPDYTGDKIITLPNDHGTFIVEEMKAKGCIFVAEGIHYSEGIPKIATISGEIEKPIKRAEDIINNRLIDEWNIDFDTRQFAASIDEIAEILKISRGRARALIENNALPEPLQEREGDERTRRIWKVSDILRVKPLLGMNKFQLIKYIMDHTK